MTRRNHEHLRPSFSRWACPPRSRRCVASFESASPHRNSRGASPAAKWRGFTLTELLVVIGLVILLLTLSLPAISFITGSRSIEGGQNQVAAMLGRAREQAIADQKIAGVFFFISPDNDRVSMALVEETDRPSTIADTNKVGTPYDQPDCVAGSATVNKALGADVYLDLVQDTEIVPLPKGVGAEMVDDTYSHNANPQYRLNPSGTSDYDDDGYIGYNQANYVYNAASGTTTAFAGTPDTTVKIYINYGGVILFDANGRLTRQRYAFKCYALANATTSYRGFVQSGTGFTWTDMGQLMYHHDRNVDSTLATPLPQPPPISNTAHCDVVPTVCYYQQACGVPYSYIGLVLFDREKFKTQFGSSNPPAEADWQIQTASNPNTVTVQTGYSISDEPKKEDWLDKNATPVMINRYNGTLLKTE